MGWCCCDHGNVIFCTWDISQTVNVKTGIASYCNNAPVGPQSQTAQLHIFLSDYIHKLKTWFTHIKYLHSLWLLPPLADGQHFTWFWLLEYMLFSELLGIRLSNGSRVSIELHVDCGQDNYWIWTLLWQKYYYYYCCFLTFYLASISHQLYFSVNTM